MINLVSTQSQRTLKMTALAKCPVFRGKDQYVHALGSLVNFLCSMVKLKIHGTIATLITPSF